MVREPGALALTQRGPQRTPYWEAEQPQEVRCGYVLLRLYERAGKLQVVGTTREADGRERFAKTVTIDVPTLRGSREALAVLLRACNADAEF